MTMDTEVASITVATTVVVVAARFMTSINLAVAAGATVVVVAG